MNRRRFRIPPAPRGLPRHLRAAYVVIAAIVAAIVASLPRCPMHDAAGRPLWRVQTVHDGDTVTCIDEKGQPRKIRLVGIDAPEFDQPHGRASRSSLDSKLAGGLVRVDERGRDQHGRLLGTLFIESARPGRARNVNEEMVRDGHAWVFGGFAPDPALLAAEDDARRNRRGLWAEPDPVAPSRWRDTHPPRER